MAEDQLAALISALHRANQLRLPVTLVGAGLPQLLGPEPHRSGDVAERLVVKVSSVAPTRNSLIAKGMLYSPAHGDTAFTVPLFD